MDPGSVNWIRASWPSMIAVSRTAVNAEISVFAGLGRLRSPYVSMRGGSSSNISPMMTITAIISRR
jgi:hypothetical protein